MLVARGRESILEAFVQVPSRQLTLSELTQQLQMNKNAVFRILHSLAAHGYVTKDGSKYELSPKIVELSNARRRNTDLLTVLRHLCFKICAMTSRKRSILECWMAT